MFGTEKNKPVDTNESKIDEILERSIDTIYPSKEDLKKSLLSGKRLSIYMGIDPTATYVHLGHATNYLLLKRLHSLGHKIIVLIGDFTAMIGDPSDKTSTRRRLTREDVTKNLKSFKSQISKILDFENTNNKIEFSFNSEWLGKLSFEDVIEIASNFTVQQMLERDNFEKRIKENKPLYVHEFFYPLMQGYDSVALGVDVEIGGTDQTFNMLAGRTLLKKMKNKEKFVITTTLLENPATGEKLMSKSLGTGVGLDLEPNEMFGKTMALPDEAIIQCFIDCTEISLDEVSSIEKKLSGGINMRDTKMRLAREITALYHGDKEAAKAEEFFVTAFQKNETPEDVIEVSGIGKKLSDVLVGSKIVSSKSEFKRLVGSGAVRNIDTGEKISDPTFVTKEPSTYKIGKHRFVKIV